VDEAVHRPADPDPAARRRPTTSPPPTPGATFLSAVLTVAATGLDVNPQEEEIALTVPVEAYEHYDQWLLSVAEQVGLPRVG
jgi:hypothetical protein